MRISAHSHVTDRREPSDFDIIAGHFVEDEGYLVRRANGASSWLLIMTLGGRGRHKTSTASIESVPGDVTLWQMGASQEYAACEEGWELVWAHFHIRPHWRTLIDWPQAGHGLHAYSCDPSSEFWRRLVSQMDEIRRLADGSWLDQFEAKQKLEGFLISIRRRLESEKSPSGDPQIDLALSWAMKHLDKPLRVDQLAKAAGLSPSGFAHKFKDVMGASPRVYLEQRRMEKARELLVLTNLPVKTVAREVGFSSEFHFSHRFSLCHGISPSHFRQREQGFMALDPFEP